MADADVSALIGPGSILLVFCHFCSPPKQKFLVVASVEPFAIGFFINTEPTKWQKQAPHLLEDLVKIAQVDYQHLLKYDSYIDCTDAICEFEFDELVATVSIDPAARIKGVVTVEDAKRIAKIVDESVNIESSNRKMILASFQRAGLI